MSKTILFLGVAAVFGVFIVPKLPQLMMAAGMTGEATGGTVEPLQVKDTQFDGVGYYDDKGFVLEWAILVQNPNPFPATVDKITYSVFVDDKEVSDGAISKEEAIPANSMSEITDEVRPDISESLSAGAGAAWNSLTGKTTYLRVEGNLHISAGPASFELPFEKRKYLQEVVS